MSVSLPPFQAVLDAHRDDVWRLLVASVGPDRADDCFQETVISALRAYPNLKHADNLRGWLLTIANHKALDEHRAAARRPLPVETLPDVPAPPASAPVDGGSDRVYELVRELPPKQRGALVLRYVLDLPHAEIGRVLDCSTESARRNLHDGLARLRARAEEGLIASG
jgi:RNA polymerase sigma factor (sigma-70 family)